MRRYSFCYLALLLLGSGCRSEKTAFYFRPPASARPLQRLDTARMHPQQPSTTLALQPRALPLPDRQYQKRPKQLATSRPLPALTSILPRRITHPTTSPQAVPYRKALRHLAHPSRDYMPLVLAVLLAALGVLLLIGTAAGSSSSFIPLVGILFIVLAGVIFFHWRYE